MEVYMLAADIPDWTLILIDIAAWGAIHLGAAYLFIQIPLRRFNENAWWSRCRSWEKQGRFYERLFFIRFWKSRLPDGARLFRGGFAKKQLAAPTAAYLDDFVKATCRAELTHYTVIALSPLFFLWNPVWVGWIMIAYALTANLPCIIAQRYNRPRLQILARAKYRGEYRRAAAAGKRGDRAPSPSA